MELNYQFKKSWKILIKTRSISVWRFIVLIELSFFTGAQNREFARTTRATIARSKSLSMVWRTPANRYERDPNSVRKSSHWATSTSRSWCRRERKSRFQWKWKITWNFLSVLRVDGWSTEFRRKDQRKGTATFWNANRTHFNILMRSRSRKYRFR